MVGAIIVTLHNSSDVMTTKNHFVVSDVSIRKFQEPNRQAIRHPFVVSYRGSSV